MARTTLDIDASVLRQVKRLARAGGKSIGRVVSELLAFALSKQDPSTRARKLRWNAEPMRSRVDLEDKEALYSALERE